MNKIQKMKYFLMMGITIAPLFMLPARELNEGGHEGFHENMGEQEGGHRNIPENHTNLNNENFVHQNTQHNVNENNLHRYNNNVQYEHNYSYPHTYNNEENINGVYGPNVIIPSTPPPGLKSGAVEENNALYHTNIKPNPQGH